MKTHKGTAKRYRKTGSGKWVRPKAWRGHHLEIKSPAADVATTGSTEVSATHTAQLERLMPYAGKGK